MREIKKYVRFYIQKRLTWEDQSADRPRNVVLMFNYDAKRLCTLTGLKVSLQDWDVKKQRVKPSVKRSAQVNKHLDDLENKINDIYYDALAAGLTPDNSHFLRLLKSKPQTEKVEFFSEWEKYLAIKARDSKSSTMTALTISRDHFVTFAKGKRLTFEDINAELLADYAEYLFSLGHADNTVHKNIKRMRAFLNYAKKIGLHNNERFRDFNVSAKTGRIIFLEWQEVQQLIQYKPENSEERKVLDNFLFGCLTAMRYSDYHILRQSDITEIHFDGVPKAYYSATIRQVKTNKSNMVPLIPEAMEIVNRNKETGLAVPSVTNQVINRVIKDIGRKAGINSLVAVDRFQGNQRKTSYIEKYQILSTHIGRKTFISVAASKSIPIHIVASIAGHSTKTCMKFYAGVADKDKFMKVTNEMRFIK
ncbi:MAG: site-specific integrase [Bacteroidetes bacterium]|nr:site-specific integrase [Bacteroidota bacterium]